ncbi:MAG: hypothetical protein AXW14_09180 [Alteromonas sp. Nap_26]|nr:MAG: hypothetical protein AXW14_09180 [Alteromonas sp. Nap_26]
MYAVWWAQISTFVGSMTEKWPCPYGVGAKIAPHFVVTGLFGLPNYTSNALRWIILTANTKNEQRYTGSSNEQ